MKKSEIEKMAIEESTYFWHVGKRLVVEGFLRQNFVKTEKGGEILAQNLKILDLGCGTGADFLVLQKFGRVSGLDISEVALDFCKQYDFEELIQADAATPNANPVILASPSTDGRVRNSTFSRHSGEVQNPTSFRHPSEGWDPEKYDLVTAFDTLEHLERDEQALRNWHDLLNQNGFLLITVPAYQWLFAAHDRALQHFRRYSRGELIKKVEAAGFKIVRASYFVTLLFPIILVQRLLTKNTPAKNSYASLPSWLNIILIGIMKFEAWLLLGVNLPFGSSIILIAEKRTS